ncbi:MAG: radical SAM protein [Alphaproteobacteria bacterium]|nr:radical SAM protein [Alphaproteobacteria bacterium]
MIVVWRITERCNLSCPFCAYDRTVPGTRHEMDATEAERFGEILGQFGRATGRNVLLSWLGGEPFLWRPIFDLSHRLRSEHGISISATTNGTTLGLERMRSAVLRSFSEITVSVDGFAAFHESMRGWPGGWGDLRDGVSALAAERKRTGADLKLRANIVVMRDNLAAFEDLCACVADWGIDEITFNQLGGRDRPEFFPAQGISPDDADHLSAIVPPLRARLAARGVVLRGGADYLNRIAASARGIALDVTDCAPGQQFLFIDERGRISPCSFTSEQYGVPVEQIRSVADLLALPARLADARLRARADACTDCKSTQVFAKFDA